MANYWPIVCVGDVHFPWSCDPTIRKIIRLIKDIQPAYTVQMGDLYDAFSWGRFARSLSASKLTPQEELSKARKKAEKFWCQVQEAAPDTRCHQLIGNHDERFKKQILGKAPEYDFIVDEGLRPLFEFPGVKTQPNERTELFINGICFIHGYRKHGTHAWHNGCNTVCGHTHKGGAVYHRRGDEVIWELNAGFCADPTAVSMSYTKQKTVSHYTKGVGVIDKHGPRFIAL